MRPRYFISRPMAEPLLSGDKDRARQGNLFEWFCSFHFFRTLRNFHEAAFLHKIF